MKRLGVIALCLCGGLYGADPVDEGPIHESFIQEVDGGIILSAVPKSPPKAVKEGKPKQTDAQSQWIEGYWSWNDDDKQFVWISGVWRRPPPAHQWISGYWKKYGQGSTWIRGFWSPVEEEDLVYIGDPPPDPIEEEVGQSRDGSFWMPGYWAYDTEDREYSWVGGQWTPLDPEWVLVPAHYEWRSEGYIFIPAYWDFPIEHRGTAYSPVMVDGGEEYTPDVVLDPQTIVRRLVVYYPNYLCFYQHHYHYHWNFWAGWWGTPPWWGWHVWWTFSWHNQWSLWWWFCHSGFPAPFWMNGWLAGQIWPPAVALLNLMQGIWGIPLIITPHGIFPVSDLRSAIGRGLPILPAVPKKRRGILDKLKPDSDLDSSLRPSGRSSIGRDRRGTPGPKPDFGTDPLEGSRPERSEVPLKPGQRPPIGEDRAPPARPGRQTAPPRPSRPYPPQETAPRPSRPYPDRPEYQPQAPTRPGQWQRPQPYPSQPIRPQPIRPQPSGPSRAPPPHPSRPGPTRPEPNRPQPGPSEIGPSQTAPRPSQPGPRQTGPSRFQPQQTRPQQIQPIRVRPEQVRPGQVQPGQVQPRQSQPRRFQMRRTQPQQTRPRGGRFA